MAARWITLWGLPLGVMTQNQQKKKNPGLVTYTAATVTGHDTTHVQWTK